jgi:hypothetical protein
LSKIQINAAVLTIGTMMSFGWIGPAAFASPSIGPNIKIAALPIAAPIASVGHNVLDAPLVAWGVPVPTETQMENRGR